MYPQLLCILTSFEVLHTPESWLKHFFQPVLTFFVYFSPFFSDFRPEIKKKHLKMNKFFFSYFAYSSNLVDMQKLVNSLGGTPKLSFFCWFFENKHFLDFRPEITEKGEKWTQKVKNIWKKVFQPGFGCVQHPKAGRNTLHSIEGTT